MTMTLHADRQAYKWARKREAEILQVRRLYRRALSGATAMDRSVLRSRLAAQHTQARIWRIRAASLETSEQLGFPL